MSASPQEIRPDYYKQPCSSSSAHVIQGLTGHDVQTWNECFDLIKIVEADYFTGAAVKYLWRCEKKGFYLEDLIKARTHLQIASEGYPQARFWSKAIDQIDALISALYDEKDEVASPEHSCVDGVCYRA